MLTGYAFSFDMNTLYYFDWSLCILAMHSHHYHAVNSVKVIYQVPSG